MVNIRRGGRVLNDDLAEQVLARTLEALDDWKNGVGLSWTMAGGILCEGMALLSHPCERHR